MSQDFAAHIQEQVNVIYQTESRRIFATLVRLFGDFDLAEEALQEGFTAAMAQWPTSGIPANPRAWLISAGRFKVIDTLRKHHRSNYSLDELEEKAQMTGEVAEDPEGDKIEDDQLRLIFTCCHPTLTPEARVALTLREVCGLKTEDIAHAFLTPPTTLAQRIVRAKAKIREAQVPYEVPSRGEMPQRLETVLQVIYLVFNEGYTASSGEQLTRADLSSEAIRLGRMLVELLPEPEAVGLLALMLLHDSRRSARTSQEGDLIRLEDQDRSLWNREQISEGTALVKRALLSGRFGIYTLQAAIAAVHSAARDMASTDWKQIVQLYDMLLKIHPSPVVELNRALALSMRDGPAAGLLLVEAIHQQGELDAYYLLHAARADLYRQMGRVEEAKSAYQRALELTQQTAERRFLERKLAELTH